MLQRIMDWCVPDDALNFVLETRSWAGSLLEPYEATPTETATPVSLAR
jgi:hypothetical protein